MTNTPTNEYREFSCAQCKRDFWTTMPISEREAQADRLYADEPLAEGDEWVYVCSACHAETLKRIAAQPDRPAAKVAFQMLRGK